MASESADSGRRGGAFGDERASPKLESLSDAYTTSIHSDLLTQSSF